MKIFAITCAAGIVGAAGWLFAQPSGPVSVAEYSTTLAGRSRSQRHNSELALMRLNGAKIGPGEVFSFNQRVGTFSRDEGYRRAPVSYNGQLIDAWGGGVCQTSTTLYNAALLSGLEIVERNRHRFAPSYVPVGRDAAVAYSSIDLKFKNPYPFAIQIRGRIDGNRLVVGVYAPQLPKERPVVVTNVTGTTAPREYSIGHGNRSARVRNTGKIGCDVSVYRITGSTRELISEDSYPAMARVVDYRD